MSVHGCAQQLEIMDPWFCVRVATSSRLIPQGTDFQHRDRFGWALDHSEVQHLVKSASLADTGHHASSVSCRYRRSSTSTQMLRPLSTVTLTLEWKHMGGGRPRLDSGHRVELGISILWLCDDRPASGDGGIRQRC